jgi:hypothetical protein
MKKFGRVRLGPSERNRMNMQDKSGTARAIGIVIAIAVAIMLALWRLLPHAR